MVIVKIIGGLGNQMFQYAYARSLSNRGYRVKIDISAFNTYRLHGGYQLDKYNINLKIADESEYERYHSNNKIQRVLKRFTLSSELITEKSLIFDSSLLDINSVGYVEGYFQTEKYFTDIRDILLNEFIINKPLSDFTIEMQEKIQSCEGSCSLHIRRGDFLSTKNSSIHGGCSLDYYQDAINHINSKTNKSRYFIFSDDMDWVKSNLKIENAIYMESSEQRIPHEDIYLMSLCNNNIIANSTFSWWGAWLNQHTDKCVVVPKTWFADNKLDSQAGDIVCDKWIRV